MSSRQMGHSNLDSSTMEVNSSFLSLCVNSKLVDGVTEMLEIVLLGVKFFVDHFFELIAVDTAGNLLWFILGLGWFS